jgi:hypothetical protein
MSGVVLGCNATLIAMPLLQSAACTYRAVCRAAGAASVGNDVGIDRHDVRHLRMPVRHPSATGMQSAWMLQPSRAQPQQS